MAAESPVYSSSTSSDAFGAFHDDELDVASDVLLDLELYEEVVNKEDSANGHHDDFSSDLDMLTMSRKLRGKGKQVGEGSKNRGRSEAVQEIPFEKRFVNAEALKRYNERYATCRMWQERPLNKDKVSEDLLDTLRERGLGALIDVPARKVNSTLVREWYANLNSPHFEAGFVKCRGVKVRFTADIINKHYDLGSFTDTDHEEVLAALEKLGRDALDDLRKSIDTKQKWVMTANNQARKNLDTYSWDSYWIVELRCFQSRLLPKENISHASMQELMIMAAIYRDIPINVGKGIYYYVKDHISSKHTLICPRLIHGLCLEAGVPEYDDDVHVRAPPEIEPEPKQGAHARKTKARALEADSSSAPPATLESIQWHIIKGNRLTLHIADSQRAWFQKDYDARDLILENQKDINENVRIKNDTRFAQPYEEFAYDSTVEQAIEGAYNDEEDEEDGDGEE